MKSTAKSKIKQNRILIISFVISLIIHLFMLSLKVKEPQAYNPVIHRVTIEKPLPTPEKKTEPEKEKKIPEPKKPKVVKTPEKPRPIVKEPKKVQVKNPEVKPMIIAKREIEPAPYPTAKPVYRKPAPTQITTPPLTPPPAPESKLKPETEPPKLAPSPKEISRPIETQAPEPINPPQQIKPLITEPIPEPAKNPIQTQPAPAPAEPVKLALNEKKDDGILTPAPANTNTNTNTNTNRTAVIPAPEGNTTSPRTTKQGGTSNGGGTGIAGNQQNTSQANAPKTQVARRPAGTGYSAPQGSINPPYPRDARERGESGTVIVEVEILETGRAGRVTITKSSGHARLDNCVLDCIRNSNFTPARKDGEPTTAMKRFVVNFDLNDYDY